MEWSTSAMIRICTDADATRWIEDAAIININNQRANEKNDVGNAWLTRRLGLPSHIQEERRWRSWLLLPWVWVRIWVSDCVVCVVCCVGYSIFDFWCESERYHSSRQEFHFPALLFTSCTTSVTTVPTNDGHLLRKNDWLVCTSRAHLESVSQGTTSADVSLSVVRPVTLHANSCEPSSVLALLRFGFNFFGIH